MRIKRFLDRAAKVAEESTHQHKIGCIIVKGHSIISEGFNRIRYASVGIRFTNYPESLHAERAATIKVRKEKLTGATAYVFRRSTLATGRCASPCKSCQELFRHVGIRDVIYSDETSTTGWSRIKL